ncbi:type I asparaginase [Aestuariicella hydrocarbonica]|uniref:L-asparaginase 1 n=1 Tax=Pseudomaricurvus hydrocarbonicus TaxID=1470433 RepID=A0A9E5T3H8_9GAMM|nr:type I asparaginase [Aestuariicella hydrocarbonica]NHO67009.1 type I asparaginase [Aestuariicella hydrocarbonica]
MPKKSIYVAYTGGTIGMKPSGQGYIPAENFLSAHLQSMPEFQRPELPEFTLQEYHPLIDSANMSPRDWQVIADDIAAHYDRYDGFVVLHGTDTMAYTASALSFMLENLNKPVIVTGSQIPLAQLRSDGHANLLNALYIAANYPIAEVGLFFNNRLFRGNRSVKTHADGFNAFESPNFGPLLEAGIDITLINGTLIDGSQINDSSISDSDRPLNTSLPAWSQPPASPPLTVQQIQPQAIGVVTLYPGISSAIIDNLLHQPLAALILQSFGVGNAPQSDDFLDPLKRATGQGTIIINCTQCLQGKVNMEGYATGNALAQAGVISGGDMTIEATLTKLHYLLSQSLSVETIRTLMTQNLRGELSS